MKDCIFCKIINGDIPATKIYDDELIFAFKDINPIADTHILVIPKKHITSLLDATVEDKEILGHLNCKIGAIAKSQGLENGFKTLVNTGKEGGQEILHIHYHILGEKIKR